MSEVGKRIGENLKKLRAEAGLTQVDVAKRLGTHQETVSRWERGAMIPSLTQVFRIAEVLHTDPGWILTRASMDAAKLAEAIRTHDEGAIEVLLEHANKLPPEARREFARRLMDLL